MPDILLKELEKIFGRQNVSYDHSNLVEKSSDFWPRNLLLPLGSHQSAKVIVKPDRKNYRRQLCELINFARRSGQKIITRGGGSGVCGAANTSGGEIIVDVTGLDSIEIVKEPFGPEAGLVAAGAGVYGGKLDGFLDLRGGYTCGHYPASLAVSTVGGWVSTGASGQFSCYFGNIENIVEAVEVVTGKGEIVNLEGKDLKKVLRMEGATAIITKVWLKIIKRSSHECFQSFRFTGLESLIGFLKILELIKLRLDSMGVKLLAVRAYDFVDFNFMSKPHKADEAKPLLIEGASRWIEKKLCGFGWRIEILLYIMERLNMLSWTVVVYSASDFAKKLESVRELIEVEAKTYRGASLGSKIAKNWYENRFKLDYQKVVKRFKAGIIVDTFDCSPTWFNLATSYYLIRSKIFKFGLAGAHIGLDKNRPYIYFIFGIPGNDLQKYDRVWEYILSDCVKVIGIRPTHHHGIGKQRAQWPRYAYGNDWLQQAEAVKKEFDPDNILNPGNIFNTGH